MKRQVFYFAVVLALACFPQQNSYAESTWEFNERHLGMESVNAESHKEDPAAKKERLEKCDAEYEACKDKAPKARKACADDNESCIKEYRRQNELCLSVVEACEKEAS